MKTYIIWEPRNVFDEVNENRDIAVGDVIVYFSYNQMGNTKYKVISALYGKKDVRQIGDYDDFTSDNQEDEEE